MFLARFPVTFFKYRFLLLLTWFFQAITVSDGLVYMSDSKGSCEANQTSTVKQTDGSGTLVLTKQGFILF